MVQKIVLYGIVSFLETGIGIWIFGKMFPKRKGMKKRQIFSEWLLYSYLMLCIWSFSKEYFGENTTQKYIQLFLAGYVTLLFLYILYACYRDRQAYTGSFIMELLFFIFMSLMSTCQYWDSYVSGPCILFGGVYPVLFLYVYYRCTFIQAYLWEFCFSASMGLLKIVYIVYAGTFENKRFEDFLWFPREHTYSEILYFLIICMAVAGLIKCFPIDQILKQMLCRHKIMLFIMTISEWWLLFRLIDYGEGNVKEKNLTITLIVVIGIMAFFIVLCAKLMVRAVNAEKNLLDVRNAAMESQYDELSEAYDRYRCLVHDEKHVILYLRECLKNGEIEEASRFLECEETILNQGSKVWTGMPNVDFMLNIKKRKMDEKGIAFQLEAEVAEIPMEDADFVVLLGNLFDNAIDATKACEVGRRNISLSMKNINEMFWLEMKNTNAVVPKVKNHRFLTGKKDAEKHGWGIESVRRIVDKYGGTVTFTYDRDFFDVLVVTNIQGGFI